LFKDELLHASLVAAGCKLDGQRGSAVVYKSGERLTVGTVTVLANKVAVPTCVLKSNVAQTDEELPAAEMPKNGVKAPEWSHDQPARESLAAQVVGLNLLFHEVRLAVALLDRSLL
jgi:hypothetical protein